MAEDGYDADIDPAGDLDRAADIEPGAGSRVSVLIPTIGRPSLRTAVDSVLAQEQPPLEVIVIFDGLQEGIAGLELPDDPRVRTLATGVPRSGPSAARVLGASRARGDLIALIDDDDLWLPAKLRIQVAEYERLEATDVDPVISCRVETFDASGTGKITPTRVYRTGEDVGDYLFRRRDILHTGYGFGSCTLLFSRELLVRTPIRTGLKLHEDWDWVLRVSRRPGVVVSMVADVLCTYHEQSAVGSASRPPGGWEASRDWGAQAGLSRAALGDFLLCVSAFNAIEYGRRGEALRIALLAARSGRPGPRAVGTFAAQFAAPRGLLAKATRAARRARPGG